MDLKIRKKDQSDIVDITGSLDIYTSVDFKEFIEKNITHSGCTVIVNMGNLSYIDSSGIGMLIKEMNYIQELSGEMALANLKPQIEKVLKVSGLMSYFRVISEEEFKTSYS